MLNVKGLVECVYLKKDVCSEVCNWAVENNLVGKNIVDILSIEEVEELANELLSTIGYKIVDEPKGDTCTLRESLYCLE